VFAAFSHSRKVLGGLAALALIASACNSATATPTQVPATPTAAPTATATAAPSVVASPTAPSIATYCGTAPVVLNAYFETGFDIPFKLSDEFTKQFPNVTFKIPGPVHQPHERHAAAAGV